VGCAGRIRGLSMVTGRLPKAIRSTTRVVIRRSKEGQNEMALNLHHYSTGDSYN
jgi:hypothetical protein